MTGSSTPTLGWPSPMLDVGGAEIIVMLVLWLVPAFVLYWIIRLGVRHGTLDAYRIDRTDQRIADMKAATQRRDGVAGDQRA